MEEAIGAAREKDAGLTAAQLAWVLSEIEIGEDAEPPGVSVEVLREYVGALVGRLTAKAFPDAGT